MVVYNVLLQQNYFDTLELKLNAVFVRSSIALSVVMPQVFLAQSRTGPNCLYGILCSLGFLTGDKYSVTKKEGQGKTTKIERNSVNI